MRSLPPCQPFGCSKPRPAENFTAAAAELSITQAAVSYQVGLLEKRLGVLLFHRQGKRVVLSDVGRQLAGKLSGAFTVMEAAFDAIRKDDAALLTISTTVTFANAWFAWKLGSFQMANPKLGVRLHADDAPVDFARDEADLAVRFGAGQWPGLSSELLLKESCTPARNLAFRRRSRRLNRRFLRAIICAILGAPQRRWLGESFVAIGERPRIWRLKPGKDVPAVLMPSRQAWAWAASGMASASLHRDGAVLPGAGLVLFRSRACSTKQLP
ncbi:MAG: LysR family transcriptional regulator [Alphaproteobacteria bacterium]